MGMIACYMQASSELIEKLKSKTPEEIFEIIEELQSGDELPVYDMDKLWDGLHFVLTGVSAVASVEGDPLSEAIVGTAPFTADEPADFITFIVPARAAEISAALDDFDIESALADFTPSVLGQNDIYPSIWDDEIRDELRDDLFGEFEGIKKFYRSVKDAHQGVIVSIY